MTLDPIASLNAKSEELGWQTRWSVATRFEHAELNRLLTLWHEKAARTFPSRTDFSLRQLKAVLPDIAIIERVTTNDGPRYRVRLLGTALAQSFGEQTGKYFDEFVPPDQMSLWTGGYGLILETAQPIRIVTKFSLPQVDYLYGEVLSAPLAGSDGVPNMILSATYTSADPIDFDS